ncbi:hypothetical protein BKA70DRAFT_1395699 [Coprinopsis sp. MPI-PUGE-AT-0042]|nr:hypothetical protein BKA70DRAFT_1395699 [Coprinopsis sp. MPI-PUGE-AT-0042]
MDEPRARSSSQQLPAYALSPPDKESVQAKPCCGQHNRNVAGAELPVDTTIYQGFSHPTDRPELEKEQGSAQRLWRRCIRLFSAVGAFKRRGRQRPEATKKMADRQETSSSREVLAEPVAAASSEAPPGSLLRAVSMPRNGQEQPPPLLETLDRGPVERQPGDGIQSLAPSAQGAHPSAASTGTLFSGTHTANIGGGSWIPRAPGPSSCLLVTDLDRFYPNEFGDSGNLTPPRRKIKLSFKCQRFPQLGIMKCLIVIPVAVLPEDFWTRMTCGRTLGHVGAESVAAREGHLSTLNQELQPTSKRTKSVPGPLTGKKYTEDALSQRRRRECRAVYPSELEPPICGTAHGVPQSLKPFAPTPTARITFVDPLPSVASDTMDSSPQPDLHADGRLQEERRGSIIAAQERLHDQQSRAGSHQEARAHPRMGESEEPVEQIELRVGCWDMFKVLNIFRRSGGDKRRRGRKTTANKKGNLPLGEPFATASATTHEERLVASLVPRAHDISTTSSVTRGARGAIGQEHFLPPVLPEIRTHAGQDQMGNQGHSQPPREEEVPVIFSGTGSLFQGTRTASVSGGSCRMRLSIQIMHGISWCCGRYQSRRTEDVHDHVGGDCNKSGRVWEDRGASESRPIPALLFPIGESAVLGINGTIFASFTANLKASIKPPFFHLYPDLSWPLSLAGRWNMSTGTHKSPRVFS